MEKKSRDPQQWLKWYEEIEVNDSDSNDVIYGEDDLEDKEEEHTEVQDDCTDTDQEADSDDETEVQGEVASRDSGPYFLAKNKETTWNKMKPSTSRTKAHNLMVKVPGSVEIKIILSLLQSALSSSV